MTCEHIDIKRTKMPDGHAHYGMIRCAACDKFMGWEKNPANAAKEKANYDKAEALKTGAANDRTRDFLASVTKQDGKLSPKQQAWLDSL